MKALMISADGFEDLELLYPYYRLKEEDIDFKLASITRGKIKGIRGYQVEADLALSEAKPEDYGLLILPGGRAPQKLRKEEDALRISKHFFEKNQPVAAICHGIQTLITAGLVKGRKATCWPGIKGELISAGAQYLDQGLVVDGNLITSRYPEDLPSFARELIKILKGS